MPRSFATGVAIAETAPTPDSAISPAGAAEVVSSNVVGYQKLTINPSGYTLLANPFVVIGTDDTFPINEMFSSGTENITSGTTANRGDSLQSWNADGTYNTYFYSSRVSGGAAWASTADSRTATTDEFAPGDGFWYKNQSANTYQLTVSGQVSTNSVTVTLNPSGYTLVCNPFPVDLPLNNGSIDWTSVGATSGTTANRGDVIQTWNADGTYNTFFFSSRVSGGAAWAASSDSRTATDYAIPAGQGFWYKNQSSETLTITLTSPLAD